MNRTARVLAIGCLFCFASASVLAGGRPDKDWRSWFGHFSGGYSLANDKCLIAEGMDPMFVPRQPRRLTTLLSVTKDRLGLLDHAVTATN